MVGDVDVRTETAIHRPVEDVAASCVGEDARAGVVREHPERRLTYAVAGGCRQPHGFRRASWPAAGLHPTRSRNSSRGGSRPMRTARFPLE